jgi:calcium permeable stress-gated cation channel
MIITFSLFWVVIKNNVLYVVRTGNVDGGALFFPSALNQTFVGLYFMEICLIGLFFLVRDVQGRVVCQAQGTIMAVVLVLTIIYQIWLTLNFSALFQYAPLRLEAEVGREGEEYESQHLTGREGNPNPAKEKSDIENKEILEDSSSTAPALEKTEQGQSQTPEPPEDILERPVYPRLPSTNSMLRSKELQAQQKRDEKSAKQILARVNRPLDERRLVQLEDRLSQVEGRVGHISHALMPKRKDIEAQMMNDPISKIIMQHNDELEDLDAEERDILLSVAFTHPIVREGKPSVWIPSDDLGVSDDEVRRTREFSEDVAIDNRGAYFDKRLKVMVDKPPPDMSEFALIMAEL